MLLGSREALERASGGVLEASWGRLGRVLGASWEARRPSWGCLGSILEAFEVILGPPNVSFGAQT